MGSDLPQQEVCVVGGGDLGREAAQVSVVDGVSGRETSLDSNKATQFCSSRKNHRTSAG